MTVNYPNFLPNVKYVNLLILGGLRALTVGTKAKEDGVLFDSAVTSQSGGYS